MLKFTPGKMLAGWLAIQCSPFAFAADTVYQAPADFLSQHLPGCEQQALWLNKELKSNVEELVGHDWPGVRVRYCRLGDRTGWILDEIGKTEPITSGIIVRQGKAERVRVLVFRESRGEEVHREAFTRQYENAALVDGGRLDRHIDGITGATLSVYAVNRQVKLALLLDGIAMNQHAEATHDD
jgi:hypothetical protein